MRKLFFFRLTQLVAFLIILQFCACTNGGEEVEKEREVSEVSVNPDPQDSLISRVEYVTDDTNKLEVIEFYGSKTDEGAIAESALLYLEGQDEPMLVQFNESGVLDQLNMPDGTFLKIKYEEGGTAQVHILGPDGEFGGVRVLLDQETLDAMAEIEALGVTGQTEPSSSESEVEAILSNIGSADTPTVAVPASGRRLLTDWGAYSADTKTVTVSRLIRLPVKSVDAAGQNLGPVLRFKEVSCQPFDCQKKKQTLYPDTSLDDWVLMIEVRLTGQVEVPYSALSELQDDCDRIRRGEEKRDKAISDGGKVSTFAVGCMLSPLGPAPPIVGAVTAALTHIADVSSVFKEDPPRCLEVVEKLSGAYLLRDYSTTLNLTVESKTVELEDPTIDVPGFRPFSNWDKSNTDWGKDTTLLNATQKDTAQLNSQEQCFSPDCQGTEQRSFNDPISLPPGVSEPCAQQVALQGLDQPHPFFGPHGYETKCPGTECDFDDPLIYKGTGTMVDELTLSCDLGSSSKTCSDTPDYVFLLWSDGSVDASITSNVFAGWDKADNPKGFEVDCYGNDTPRVDSYEGTHQNGTFELFLKGTFSGTYAGNTLSGELVKHKESIVPGFTHRVESVRNTTHTFTLSKSCSIDMPP